MAETVTPKYAGNYSAVMRYGGNFSAVNGFSFLAVTALADTVTPKYAGNYSAVRLHAGNFSAVNGFSFFGGYAHGNSKVDGNYLIIIIWRCIARTFSLLLSSH